MAENTVLDVADADIPTYTSPDEKVDQTETMAEASPIDHLGAFLTQKFQEWKDSRRPTEDGWLEDLQAFNAKADGAETRKDTMHGDVFVQLTRTKCLTAYARLTDTLFQAKDEHWAIEPTPVPETAAPQFVTIPETGEQVQIPPEVLKQQAIQQMQRMSKTIADQLAELDYEDSFKSAVLEMCVYGTGVLRGVTPGLSVEASWKNTGEKWEFVNEEIPYPDLQACSIFDVYPDPYCTKTREATGIFHRHVLTRQQVRELLPDPRFKAEVIHEILNTSAKGQHVELSHEVSLKNITGITASFSVVDRFDVIEYWGLVSGNELIDHGVDGIAEEGADYYANVWFCGSRVIMAMISPLKRQSIPYTIVPYERVPHQIWGVGPARMIKDSQKMINAAVQRVLDNMAITSAPQFEVNTNVLAEGEDPRDIRPFKVHLRDGGDPSYPLLRMYQPNNNIQPLTMLVDMFRRFADEESNIPAYTSGQTMPGLNKTASGMSMLMGQANVTLKSVVSNVDKFMIVPIIQAMFDWNMQWNPDESIKGDMKAVAKGITSLLAKEVQSQRLVQFAQITANPVDMQIVDRRGLIKEIAKSLDLDAEKILLDEHEPLPQQQMQEQTPADGAGGGGNPFSQAPEAMGTLGDVPDPAV